MNTLLITLVVIGAWNWVNMMARIYYKQHWTPYTWHVITGFWAAWLLWGPK